MFDSLNFCSFERTCLERLRSRNVSLIAHENLPATTANCDYNIVPYYYEFEEASIIQLITAFRFIIRQRNCRTKAQNILGGTTFEILAYDELFLLKCSTCDLENNDYDVLCHYPTESLRIDRKLPENLLATISNVDNNKKCLRITAIVMYEQLEEYSPGTSSALWRLGEQHRPIRLVFSDDDIHCFPAYAATSPR